ncbi:MAG: winged helix DNA-binding protein [Sphingobium sp.]|nr:winged helix DNA-binding protein [Sphingobium sp.]
MMESRRAAETAAETGDRIIQDLPYGAHDARPGLLVMAEQAMPQAFAEIAEAAGLRLLGVTSLEEGPARLDSQSGCDLAMLVCASANPMLERLLVQLDTMATLGDMPLIVVTSIETLDMADAVIRSPRAHLLCQPDATDLSAALLAARPEGSAAPTVHDIGRESESARLNRLSEEVGRLARTVEALASGHPSIAGLGGTIPPGSTAGTRLSDQSADYNGMPALGPLGAQPAPSSGAAVLTAGQVRDLLRARRLRAEFLPAELFADPAWDMLLDLLAARLDGARVSVSSLCIAAAVPPTTALRWIRTLTEQGLVERRADPHDGRRVFIALADDTVEALQRWFAAGRRLIQSAAGA